MNTAQTMIPAEAPATDGISSASSPQSLRGCVEQAMENYFQNLDGQPVSDVYDDVSMRGADAARAKLSSNPTSHNQTKAPEVLGLKRGTLRKKLKQYGLL